MKDYSLHSGERFPTLDLNLIGNDHLFRYEYVISKLGNSKNRLFGIDVFCGSGYGAALMSRKMNASILAIDGSTEAIENARQKILAPNIIWASKQFPFELPKDIFDFVASMESIEHVKDHEAFFWTLVNCLKPGGSLFFSTPNEDVMPYQGYKWHYKHFRPSEVRELASQFNLEEIAAFATSAQVYKDGKASLYYPYQIAESTPLDLSTGDISFFEFKKK